MTMIPECQQKSLDESLIPLINIVFLLLIFFLIAGQISHQQDQRIQAPESASENTAAHPEWMLEMASDRGLRLNGQRIDLQQLPAQLAAINPVGNQRISVKVDRALLAEDLDKLLEVLRDSGVLSVTLLTKATVQ
ncbi:MAG: biopolymer transporter ExbD [Ketobacter sp.]|nr:biopolymer transporter ExbD [Ketobacter sp.]